MIASASAQRASAMSCGADNMRARKQAAKDGDEHSNVIRARAPPSRLPLRDGVSPRQQRQALCRLLSFLPSAQVNMVQHDAAR